MKQHETKTLSIIIPLYNTERYIDACIQSILNSGLHPDDYEIVVVNDGSTDKGPEIAEKYVDSHKNIHIISQPNQGLSAARNTGLKHCKGRYIWFIDSDDTITKEATQILESLSFYGDLDILAIQLQKTDDNLQKISLEANQISLQKNKIMSGGNAVINGYFPCSACALIMRTDFLKDNAHIFKVGITHEDVEFTYRVMPTAQRVVFSEITPYLYYTRTGSMSHSTIPQKIIKYLVDDIEVYKSFNQTAKRHKENVELASIVTNRANLLILGLCLQLLRNRKKWANLGINNSVIEYLRKEHLYPVPFKYKGFKKNILKHIVNIEMLIK